MCHSLLVCNALQNMYSGQEIKRNVVLGSNLLFHRILRFLLVLRRGMCQHFTGVTVLVWGKIRNKKIPASVLYTEVLFDYSDI